MYRAMKRWIMVLLGLTFVMIAATSVTAQAPSEASTDQADQAGPRQGFGQGQFANLTPEERQQLRERLQQMSPEERAQLRGRGGRQAGSGDDGQGVRDGRFAEAPPEEGQQLQDRVQQASPEERQRLRAQFGQGTRASGQGRGEDQAPPRAAAPAAVVPSRPVVRPIWVLTNGHLERALVNIGISDGAVTAVLSGPLQPGAQVVTGVAQAQTATQGGANPLLPFGGRFPGQQGGRGGGGFVAGGARGGGGAGR